MQKLTQEQTEALQTVKKMEGRSWRMMLSIYWTQGYPSGYEDIAPILQNLRNDHDFGPRGLKNLKLPKE